MNNLQKIFVIVFILFNSLNSFAENENESIEELNSQIASQNKAQSDLKKQRSDIQSVLDAADDKIRSLKSEKNKLSIDIKKINLKLKKANMLLSSPNEKEKAKTDIIGFNFDMKRAESDIAKKDAEIAKLEKEKVEVGVKLGVIDGLLKSQGSQQTLVVQKKIVQKKTEEKNDAEFIKDYNARRMEAMAQARKITAQKEIEVQKEAADTVTKAPDMIVDEPVIEETPAQSVRQQQEALVAESESMKPAYAALNLAKARALVPMSGTPILGDSPNLGYSKPVGSKVKSLGSMLHLGNNQYMLETAVVDGKQEFVVGSHKFFKMIPSQYNGVTCMILLDLQRPETPNFQVIVVN